MIKAFNSKYLFIKKNKNSNFFIFSEKLKTNNFFFFIFLHIKKKAIYLMHSEKHLHVSHPSQIGVYRFMSTIGEGSYSVVKLVKNTNSKAEFACKIVPKDRIMSKTGMEHFENEVRIMQKMTHPNIVHLIDLLQDKHNYYVIMDFCSCGELLDLIRQSKHLKEQEAKFIFMQICRALNYIHSFNIAHRDLKPENILLDEYGMVKVSDFGFAKFIPQSNVLETPCGSPCYSSPECISGAPYDGKKSDIWSLGVILYAMVVGCLPWTKRNKNELFSQIKSGYYHVPNNISEHCKNLIERMLTVDPDKRITLPEIFDHPWVQDCKTFPIQKYFIPNVSIRKCDQFFFKDISELNIPKSIHRTDSQPNLNFNKAHKHLIIDPRKPLPPLMLKDVRIRKGAPSAAVVIASVKRKNAVAKTKSLHTINNMISRKPHR